jgi:hypothetical protein
VPGAIAGTTPRRDDDDLLDDDDVVVHRRPSPLLGSPRGAIAKF